MALDIEDILALTTPANKKTKEEKKSTSENNTFTSGIPFNTIIPDNPKSKPKPKVNRSKRKGNKFENDTAKLLGEWMFNDREALCRSITSGAKKTVYTGDIVPQKQLPNLKDFVWHIECKNGYKTQIPSFNNFALIEKWLLKCLTETDFKKQPIIWLICRFHGYTSILLTNCPFYNVKWSLCVNIELNNTFNFFYSYKLDDLTSNEFWSVMKLDGL